MIWENRFTQISSPKFIYSTVSVSSVPGAAKPSNNTSSSRVLSSVSLSRRPASISLSATNVGLSLSHSTKGSLLVVVSCLALFAKRARQLTTTSRDPLVEWDNDKPTLVALREIEAGLLDKETLDRTLEEDVLLDGFAAPGTEETETVE